MHGFACRLSATTRTPARHDRAARICRCRPDAPFPTARSPAARRHRCLRTWHKPPHRPRRTCDATTQSSADFARQGAPARYADPLPQTMMDDALTTRLALTQLASTRLRPRDVPNLPRVGPAHDLKARYRPSADVPGARQGLTRAPTIAAQQALSARNWPQFRTARRSGPFRHGPQRVPPPCRPTPRRVPGSPRSGRDGRPLHGRRPDPDPRRRPDRADAPIERAMRDSPGPPGDTPGGLAVA